MKKLLLSFLILSFFFFSSSHTSFAGGTDFTVTGYDSSTGTFTFTGADFTGCTRVDVYKDTFPGGSSVTFDDVSPVCTSTTAQSNNFIGLADNTNIFLNLSAVNFIPFDLSSFDFNIPFSSPTPTPTLTPTPTPSPTNCPNPSDNPCWVAKSPMPTARRDLGVAADASGKIYAVGGLGANGLVSTLEVYNPFTDSWITKSPAPVAQYDMGFAFNPTNGKFYMAGGGGVSPVSDVYEYDPTTDTWTQKASLPTPDTGLRLAISGGKVYAISGAIVIANYVTNVFEYDPTTNTWTVKSAIPTPRADASLVAAPNGKIYLIGGGIQNASIVSVNEYNPITDTWISKTPMSIPKSGLGASMNVNGNIYALGGNDPNGAFFINTVEEYNPTTNTWTTRTSFPFGIFYPGMALGGDGKVYVMGGWTASSGASNTNYAGSVPTGVSQLTSLSPAKIWIGLKNSDDVGTRFDLKAEVYKDGTGLVSSGQLDNVWGGSSGFNNASLQTIPFNNFTPVDFPQGSTLSINLYVRNACVGPTHNSGTARLWYNDSAANSRFDATIDLGSSDYFLRDGFILAATAGPGPKKIVDVAAGAKCSAFKTFGTWSITP